MLRPSSSTSCKSSSSACPVCISTSTLVVKPHSEGCFFSGLSEQCRAVLPPLPEIDVASMGEKDEIELRAPNPEIPITFFSAPRAFDSDTNERQRAAILSWHMLPSQSKEVILFGDEAGIANFASEWGIRHQPKLAVGDDGIPLMDAMFKVHKKKKHFFF